MTRTVAMICAFFIAAIALAAAAAANAAPAHAYYNASTEAVADQHLNDLRWPPQSPSFRPCIGKDQTLRAGDFNHGAYLVSEDHRDDSDLLNAHIIVPTSGVYFWEVCRGWNARLGKYEVRSTLTGQGWSHTILNRFERDPNDFSGPSHLYGNGSYEWGGRIAPYEENATEIAGG